MLESSSLLESKSVGLPVSATHAHAGVSPGHEHLAQFPSNGRHCRRAVNTSIADSDDSDWLHHPSQAMSVVGVVGLALGSILALVVLVAVVAARCRRTRGGEETAPLLPVRRQRSGSRSLRSKLWRLLASKRHAHRKPSRVAEALARLDRTIQTSDVRCKEDLKEQRRVVLHNNYTSKDNMILIKSHQDMANLIQLLVEIMESSGAPHGLFKIVLTSMK